MRKRLFLFLSVLLLLWVAAIGLAQEPSVQFEYKQESEGIHITRAHLQNVTELVIPSVLDGRKVVAIERFAIDGRDNHLQKIVLPEGLKIMAPDACINGYELAAYEISPENPYFTSIDGVIFKKHKDGSLSLCAYPQGKPGDSYQLPAQVTEILPMAMYINLSIKTLILPEGVKKIGAEAFSYSDIEVLGLPASLKQVTDSTFSHMRDLQRIDLASGNTALIIRDKALLTADGKRLLVLPARSDVDRFDVPVGVKIIGDGAFEGHPTLTSITLPDGVQIIGKGAFKELHALREEIILPASVRRIGDDAFLGYQPSSITLPEGLETIGQSAFQEAKLKSVHVPDTVTKIGHSAFARNDVLQEVKLSGKMQSLPWLLFDGCTALREVIIPHGVEEISEKAFSGCKDVVIHIPDTLTVVHPEAFKNAWTGEQGDLSTFTFAGGESSPARRIARKMGINYVVDTSRRYIPTKPDGAYTSPDGMFDYLLENNQATIRVVYNVDKKRKIVIPGDIEGHPVVAVGKVQRAEDKWVSAILAKNAACRELVLSEGIQYINYGALAETPIEKITLPDSLLSIGGRAFAGSNIKALALPKELQTLEPGALDGMKKLNKLTVKGIEKDSDIDENTRFFSFDGMLYQKEQNEEVSLIACLPSKSGTAVVREGVTRIAPRAFANCDKVTKVVLPDGLREIGEKAFYQMKGLKSVLLPASLHSIGQQAFGENGLTAFEIAEENPYFTVVEGVLFSRDLGTLVEYPGSSKAKEYTVPGSVVSLSPGVFSKCKNLSSVVLPEGLTSIGKGAFNDNPMLTTITLPSTLKEIPDGAFNNNKKLTNVIGVENLDLISPEAFQNCPRLKTPLPGR